MFRERGYLHRFDTGHVVLTDHGVGVIEGVQIIRQGSKRIVGYFVAIDSTNDMKVVNETEILGHCTKEMRGRRQTETLPIKEGLL